MICGKSQNSCNTILLPGITIILLKQPITDVLLLHYPFYVCRNRLFGRRLLTNSPLLKPFCGVTHILCFVGSAWLQQVLCENETKRVFSNVSCHYEAPCNIALIQYGHTVSSRNAMISFTTVVSRPP